jgi:cytochrome c oxidase cbb3-type subunit 3
VPRLRRARREGFPNLTDGDWLYGGDPETIKKTILDGRRRRDAARWPRARWARRGEGTCANFVRSLSGLEHDGVAAARGKPHVRDLRALPRPEGAATPRSARPNLTDKGVGCTAPRRATIFETITRRAARA